MDDENDLEQLREDILKVVVPGAQRDIWLAWLAQLRKSCRFWSVTKKADSSLTEC